MRKVEIGTIVYWLTLVSVGMSTFDSGASAQVESTGFEAIDGWVAGYSICGPEFAATCSYPITNACVPNDHAASQNCCEGDPNERTGWYMDDGSQHCHEPHIDTAHPFSGLQHLRFQRDAQAGSPPGCGGNETTTQCNITASSPRLGSQPAGRTVVSFQIARGQVLRTGFAFDAIAEDGTSDHLAALVGFGAIPPALGVPDFCGVSGGYAPLLPAGVYGEVIIELDPAANTVRYCYAGNTVLLTKFGPSRATTVQGGTFRASNGGAWDIDDFSIVRGTSAPVTCREFPSECQTACGPRPCAALKAVAVNGEPIPSTTDVHVHPGDVIETEIRFSGWGGNIPELRLYQVKLLLRDAAASGTTGTLLPFGWDAPLDPTRCGTALDCSPTYPVCYPLDGICVGPGHNPSLGAFITTGRADFALFGLPGFFPIKRSYLNYVFGGVGEESVGNADSGVPCYGGTLILQVSNDACGTFTVPFDESWSGDYYSTFLGDTSNPPLVIGPAFRSLVVHVCEDDGLFCNGIESCDAVNGCQITPPPDCDDGNDCTVDSCNEATRSCDHIAICGACCDAWPGECHDAVARADCVCPNCVWTGGADCADVACKAEFVAIPTLSQWGVVVLTLLLLTGGKVLFGRRSGDPTTQPGG